jgi:isoleucyl-tRNA synthetase
MAPILAFTAEEIWAHLPAWDGKEASVHLSGFPPARKEWLDEALAGRWERFLQLRGEVTKALELARKNKVIGLALDARVVIMPPASLLSSLREERHLLEDLFIVSQVKVSEETPSEATLESSEIPGLRIRVEPARGSKCARCWKWDETVGADPGHPQACDRCAGILKRLGG